MDKIGVVFPTCNDILGGSIYQNEGKSLLFYLSPICVPGYWYEKQLCQIADAIKTDLFIFDMPGMGLSQGGIINQSKHGLIRKFQARFDFNLQQLSSEIQQGLAWLKEHYGYEKIYLLGSSLGGILASYILACDQGRVIDGVIFQAGFASKGKEIRTFVKPRMLLIPQKFWFKKLAKAKKHIGLPIPVFFFVQWSNTLRAVTLDLKKTIEIIRDFKKNQDTIMSFTPRCLHSLVFAPEICLPANVPTLLIRSEGDNIPANEHFERFLKRHPCKSTMVLLRGASHLPFGNEKHVQTLIREIQHWIMQIKQ